MAMMMLADGDENCSVVDVDQGQGRNATMLDKAPYEKLKLNIDTPALLNPKNAVLNNASSLTAEHPES